MIGSLNQAYNEVPVLSGESAWIIPFLVVGTPVMQINYQASEQRWIKDSGKGYYQLPSTKEGSISISSWKAIWHERTGSSPG